MHMSLPVRLFDVLAGLLVIGTGLTVLVLFGFAGLYIALGALFDISEFRDLKGHGEARFVAVLTGVCVFAFSILCIWRGVQIMRGDPAPHSSAELAAPLGFGYRAGRACGRLVRGVLFRGKRDI